MCNLYSITTNQAAIIPLFRVINRYVGGRRHDLNKARDRSKPRARLLSAKKENGPAGGGSRGTVMLNDRSKVCDLPKATRAELRDA
jgi:hypothetical protein